MCNVQVSDQFQKYLNAKDAQQVERSRHFYVFLTKTKTPRTTSFKNQRPLHQYLLFGNYLSTSLK